MISPTADVSIFVSYYNGMRYLPTFLKNYTEQTMFDRLEMVFVGCLLTDEEKSVLSEFQKEHPDRLKVVAREKLEPQSVCWNESIRLSSSELVCEWNVDDIRTPDSIERQYNYMNNHPEYGVCTGPFATTNTYPLCEGKYVEHRFVYPRRVWQSSMLLGPFFMFRKSLCEEIGYFDEQLKSAADYDFSVRLLTKTEVGFTNYLLGYFLDEGKGLSTGNNQLQPIERTVVEMRYGVSEKLDHRFVAEAKKYDIETIHQANGETRSASEFVLNLSDEIVVG